MVMAIKKAVDPQSKKNGRTISSRKSKTLTFKDQSESFFNPNKELHEGWNGYPHRHHALNQIEVLKERILYIQRGLELLSSHSVWNSPRGKF